METIPGLYLPLLINGVAMDRGPSSITITFEIAETSQRTKNADLNTHMLSPFNGSPLRIRKMHAVFGWDSLLGPDIFKVNRLIARGSGDIGIYSQVTEDYRCAVGTASGILMRGDAYTVYGAPTGTGTDYAPYACKDDGTPMTITIGTRDAATGRTPWTGTSLGAADFISVAYYPLARFRVTADQPLFPMFNQRGQTLTMDEI